ncbi:hypothetical protein D4R42_04845 [bacterium]|nr:MAG: hypothetical protein D4R42_04845 [bacterium]
MFRTNLNEIVKQGGKGSFVIFTTTTREFIQFAGSKDGEGGLVCAIPIQERVQEQEKQLSLGFYRNEDVETKKL